MTFVSLRPVAVAGPFLVLMLTAIGCQKEDDVRHYSVPKEKAAPGQADDSDRPQQRILGAFIPWQGVLWVFKVMGPEAALKEYASDFEGFMDSVTFKDGRKEPEYKVPDKWRPSKGTRFSVAAFRLGSDEQAPELTISPTSGTVLENLNRWRNSQLGLAKVDDDGLKQSTKEKKFGDASGVLVDLTGTGGSAPGRGPMAGGSSPPAANPHAAAQSSPLKYTVPNGWEKSNEVAKAGIRREAVFTIKDGSRSAEASVMAAGGSVLANVNRWRQQLGLGELGGDEFNKQAAALIVGGSAAVYVDFSAEGAAPDRKRILGAILQRNGRSWFFVLRGPADLVGREKPAFEEFLKSVRFEGDANE